MQRERKKWSFHRIVSHPQVREHEVRKEYKVREREKIFPSLSFFSIAATVLRTQLGSLLPTSRKGSLGVFSHFCSCCYCERASERRHFHMKLSPNSYVSSLSTHTFRSSLILSYSERERERERGYCTERIPYRAPLSLFFSLSLSFFGFVQFNVTRASSEFSLSFLGSAP